MCFWQPLYSWRPRHQAIPFSKLILNRLANGFIRILFRHRLNDTTNAFKAYRRTVIDGVRPILSPHFNITVELPLKAIVRGYSWAVIPITWRNRRHRDRQTGHSGNGQSISLHLPLRLAREVFFPRRLSQSASAFIMTVCFRNRKEKWPTNKSRRRFSSCKFEPPRRKRAHIFENDPCHRLFRSHRL